METVKSLLDRDQSVIATACGQVVAAHCAQVPIQVADNGETWMHSRVVMVSIGQHPTIPQGCALCPP